MRLGHVVEFAVYRTPRCNDVAAEKALLRYAGGGAVYQAGPGQDGRAPGIGMISTPQDANRGSISQRVFRSRKRSKGRASKVA